jgi:hypothetical protein
VLGLTDRSISKSGFIVRTALTVTEPSVAPIVEVVEAVTMVAATEKVAEVPPAGMETLAGSDALALLEVSATTIPAAGAGLLMDTVPTEVDPPVMVLGANVMEVSTGAEIERVAAAVAPWKVPVIVAMVEVAMATVVTVKVAVFAPAAITTVVGTTALTLLEVSATDAPPVGAGPLRVTVPVEEVPPFTVVGAKAREVSEAAVMLKVA